MGNPQTEDGYIKIANELWEALCCFRIPGECRQVFDAIIRKTYGFNKKEDWIAQTQIVEMTGISKGHVSRSIKRLIKHKIVTKTGNLLGINKNYTEWEPFKVTKTGNSKKVTKNGTKVTKSGNKKLPKVGVTKDNKDNIQKTNILSKDNICKVNDLIKLFEPINPNYERLFANKTQRSAIERLVEKYGEAKVRSMLSELPRITSQKYAPRITTPLQLETKLGELIQFVTQNKNKKGKVGMV